MQLKTVGGKVIAVPGVIYECGRCGETYEEKPKECDCGLDFFHQGRGRENRKQA